LTYALARSKWPARRAIRWAKSPQKTARKSVMIDNMYSTKLEKCIKIDTGHYETSAECCVLQYKHYTANFVMYIFLLIHLQLFLEMNPF